MNMLSKVVICGTREYTDWYSFYLKVHPILSPFGLENIEIVCGGSMGPDLNAMDYANINHMKLTVKRARWDLYGKSAVFRRNADIMRYCLDTKDRRLIAFWDGKSPEVKQMINICTLHEFDVKVIRI